MNYLHWIACYKYEVSYLRLSKSLLPLQLIQKLKVYENFEKKVISISYYSMCRCKLLPVISEVDRMLRPQGKLIVRDTAEAIGEVESMARSLNYEVKRTSLGDSEGLLCVQKTMWRPKEVETSLPSPTRLFWSNFYQIEWSQRRGSFTFVFCFCFVFCF